MFPKKPVAAPAVQPVARPSSRHKRHADTMAPNRLPGSMERKPRKRRAVEKIGASVVSVYFIYSLLLLCNYCLMVLGIF